MFVRRPQVSPENGINFNHSLSMHLLIYLSIAQIEKREVMKMKSEVEELQDDVLADLTQIREIMKTLLELERREAEGAT